MFCRSSPVFPGLRRAAPLIYNFIMSKALVILCGGKSTRMGCDKATLPFGNTSLLEYQVKRFSRPFEKIYISTSEALFIDKKEFGNCEIITDEIPEIGPMGGLFSCMKASAEDVLFFTSVDSPFTDVDLALELCEKPEQDPKLNICGLKNPEGGPQPLFCAYSRKCLPVIEKLITEKNYRLRKIFEQVSCRFEDRLLDQWQFFNMNDRSSYYSGLEHLSQKKKEHIFAVSFSAKSGTGKTTYLEKLIPLLKEKGLRVAVLKHDAHGFEIDKPGKDSYRLRAAGADHVIISSGDMTAEIITHTNAPKDLHTLLSRIEDADIVLTEGYKFENLPKICLLRKGYSEKCEGSPENVIAFAADFPYESELPVFDLNNPAEMADFLAKCCIC